MSSFLTGKSRHAAWRAGIRVATASFVVLATSMPAAAATSPLGDTSGSWPVGWSTYRHADGTAVYDRLGDENPDNADLSSGPCTPTGCTGGLPTVYYASDGTNAFFRVRIATDPADATKGGLTGNAYLTQIATPGTPATVRAVVGVDGKSASVDYVYTATAPGTTVTPIYQYPFTDSSAGMRVVPDGSGHWFLDYQVPIARITAASGGTVSASTPIQLYYGSSAAANLATINKDFMVGGEDAVSFGGLAIVSFAPAALSTTSGAVHLSGPNPPVVGTATTYTITLTVTNTGGGEISGASAVATLPAGVTYVSGDVSMTGSTLTWAAGTLLPGQTKSVPVVVSLTPTAAAASVPLLSTLESNGTDVATGSTRTASAPALTVGPVVADNVSPVAAADTLTVAEDASSTVDVLANDTDADGDALTATITTQPVHGTASILDGIVTYTPTADYNGADSLTYTVCDPDNVCDTATVTITVSPVNDPPTAPPDSGFSTGEDTPYSGDLPGGTDPDGDSLAFSVDVLPAHGDVTIETDGSFTYTPDADYSGPDSFTYEVCDPSGACADATVSVTVVAAPPGNQPPPAPADSSFSTTEDTAYNATLPASVDPDGDTVTYSVTDEPVHGTLTVQSDGDYSYTPDAGYNGPDSFSYQVCDPFAACATATVSITVTPVNDPPPSPPDSSFTTPEDTPHSGTLPGSVDPDGDALTFNETVWVGHGSVEIGPTGDYTYTPDADYNGPDSFGYEVCDPSGACAAAVVSITVTPLNDPPPPPPDSSFDTAEDTPHTGTLPGSVDPDGDALTYVVVDEPTHGELTVDTDGDFTYTPDDDYVGPDSFSYEVCDPSGACATAEVTVTVTAVNDPPAATEDTSFTTPEDVAHSGTIVAPVDPDGDALTFSALTAADYGSVAIAADGSYTYTPYADYFGPDAFSYAVCDPSGACAPGTVTITVTPVNDPPAPPPDSSFITGEDTPHSGNVPGSEDPDGDPLTFGLTEDAVHGTVTVEPDGDFTYTPDPDYFGDDAFSYEVCDPSDACASATVTITVVSEDEPNNPPVAVDDVVTTPYGVTLTFDPRTNDADADGDAILALPPDPMPEIPGATITWNGTSVTYEPPAGFSGTHAFDYLLCDDNGGCDTGRITVTVGAPPAVNEPPVADAGVDQTAESGAGVTLDGTASSDPDADPLTYSWVQTGGPVVVITGADTATPTFAGVDGPAALTFELTVSDGQLTDTDSVTVTVEAPPPLPEEPPLPPVEPPVPAEPPAPATPTAGGDGVTRPRALPNTGTPMDVLPPVAVLLVVVGACMQRRRAG